MPDRRDASPRPEAAAWPQPAADPFAVLYEDGDLLAVDKPAGLVVHPAYRHPDGTLFDAVLACQTARGEARPCLLHRLDRDTSGVVLFAKTAPARRALVRQFERRQVRKWYLALVAGHPAAMSGIITQSLRRDPLDRRRVVVDPAGQPAETRYRVLAAADTRALLLVEPHTGRTHQIRAHLAWLGHPLLGDATYTTYIATIRAACDGNGQSFYAGDYPRQSIAGYSPPIPSPNPTHARTSGGLDAHGEAPARHLLHAWVLGVRHPTTAAPLRFVAPLPPDFAACLPDAWRARCANILAAWDDTLEHPDLEAHGGGPGHAARASEYSGPALAGRSLAISVSPRLTAEPPTSPPNEEAGHASCQH